MKPFLAACLLAFLCLPAMAQYTPPSGGGGDTIWQEVDVPITKAQLNNCFTTKIELLPAPGANKIALVCSLVLNSEGGAPAYTLDPDTFFVWGYGDGTRFATSISQVVLTNEAPTTVSAVGLGFPQGETSWAANLPINLWATIANPTDGTGDMTAHLIYTVIDGF